VRDSGPFDQGEVIRFEYNRSIRKWRYFQIVIWFVVAGVFIFFQGGHVDYVFIGVLIGLIVAVLVVSELSLRRVQKQAIEIDFNQHQIRLEYFVYPESFFDIKRKPMVSIPFDQIRTVRQFSSHKSFWENVCVETDHSRFAFQDYFDDFNLLMDLLRQIASETEPSPLRRNPMILGIVAGLIGLGIVGFIGYLLGWI